MATFALPREHAGARAGVRVKFYAVGDDESGMPCPRIEKCPMFPQLNGTLELWKACFCNRDPEYMQCARFKLFSASQPVPPDLMPNGKLLGPVT